MILGQLFVEQQKAHSSNQQVLYQEDKHFLGENLVLGLCYDGLPLPVPNIF